MNTLVRLLLVPLVVSVPLLACNEEDEPTCTVDGVEHAIGDSFPSSDGCNTCSCGEGGVVACTTRACVQTCTYDGTVH